MSRRQWASSWKRVWGMERAALVLLIGCTALIALSACAARLQFWVDIPAGMDILRVASGL